MCGIVYTVHSTDSHKHTWNTVLSHTFTKRTNSCTFILFSLIRSLADWIAGWLTGCFSLSCVFVYFLFKTCMYFCMLLHIYMKGMMSEAQRRKTHFNNAITVTSQFNVRDVFSCLRILSIINIHIHSIAHNVIL